MIKVEYVDHMGDDLSVVNAARVSFAKESEWEWEECGVKAFGNESYQRLSDKDDRLIKFLAREKHELPFAHTAITLRCSAPVPIRTQAFKSKIGFVENEESRRYISSEPEIFIPDAFRLAASNKKQGSGYNHPDNFHLLAEYTTDARYMVGKYMSAIERGVCPEQARFWLPQGVMVNWIWTGSLLAYARFYNLRSKSDAQKEIQELASCVDAIMEGLFPASWNALTSR